MFLTKFNILYKKTPYYTLSIRNVRKYSDLASPAISVRQYKNEISKNNQKEQENLALFLNI